MLKFGMTVYFTNEQLHDIDDAYPHAGAEGTFIGYSRPDKTLAWVQWDVEDTKGDGIWACLVTDLVVLNEAVG